MGAQKIQDDVKAYSEDAAELNAELLVKMKELSGSAELGEAERLKKTAELMAYDLRAKEALAERYAAKAVTAGDVDRANLFSKVASDISDMASGVESKIADNMTSAQFKGVLGDIAEKGPIGEALAIYEMGVAVDSGNWDDLGSLATSLLYATLGALVAGATIASLPITGTALAVLTVVAEIFGAIYGADVGSRIWDIFNQDPEINSDVNGDFSLALNFIQRRDPLTLDLDGDGIETVSANSGITFDFDGDGLKRQMRIAA